MDSQRFVPRAKITQERVPEREVSVVEVDAFNFLTTTSPTPASEKPLKVAAEKTQWLDATMNPYAGVFPRNSIMMHDIDNDGFGELVSVHVNEQGQCSVRVQRGKKLVCEWVSLFDDTKTPHVGMSILNVSAAAKSSIIICSATTVYQIDMNHAGGRISNWNLAPSDINDEEKQLWNGYHAASCDELSEGDSDMLKLKLVQDLRKLDGKYHISPNSRHLLSHSNDTIKEYIDSHPDIDFPDYITCVSRLYKSLQQQSEIQYLVIGTEYGTVLILSLVKWTIIAKFNLPHREAPVALVADGSFELGYTILVATRDAVIYQLKNNVMQRFVLYHYDIIDMCLVPQEGNGEMTLAVASTDSMVTTYRVSDGVYLFGLKFDADVTFVKHMSYRLRNSHFLIVGLSTNRILIYSGDKCISRILTSEIPTDAVFGQLETEPSGMAIVGESGGLSTKFLKRSATLDSRGPSILSTLQDLQNRTLPMPTTTTLSVEQAKRERVDPKSMHTVFQRDLQSFRLLSARTYLNNIKSNANTKKASSKSPQISVQCEVLGMGPLFNLEVNLRYLEQEQEQSSDTVFICIRHDSNILKVTPALTPTCALVPGYTYRYIIKVERLNIVQSTNAVLEEEEEEAVAVQVCHPSHADPLAMIVLNIPQSLLTFTPNN